MASLRDIDQRAAWCSMYEFEDVIADVDSVDRIDLQQGWGYPLRRKAVSSLVWRQISPFFASLNPGAQTVTLDRDYDLFAYVCCHSWELLFLNAIEGWKERCGKKVCFIFEIWPGLVPDYRHLLHLLDDFDHVILGLLPSVEPVQDVTSAACHFLPPAVDTLRFTPFPDPPVRSIDLFSLGRRSEEMHQQFLELSHQQDFFYLYDTIPGNYIRPSNHQEHRDLFANLGKRSKFFVTYPAKVDKSDETQGSSEPGMRYYEGLATGAVMIGQEPDSEVFRRDFDWPDSVVSIGNSMDEFQATMERFRRNPSQFEQLTRRNAVEALRKHDWAHRWNDMLKLCGLSPTRKYNARIKQLSSLADEAEQKPGTRSARLSRNGSPALNLS